ncbi:putative porin [Niabella ginsengisoli]|uniref:putative porin n=1 Tax=Niabella ginsengisoli TaxID=522298 RepID=UPI00293ED267|nr:putative porin [Niabella ginsengisoli]
MIGNGPVNVPTIFTRNRFLYEGTLGFNNLRIAMGFDTRYRTDYNGNNYSPLLGQFFYQDATNVAYKLPDIAAFIHFRINSFRAFLRAENLNTFRSLKSVDGSTNYGFTNSNYAAPDYLYPGFNIRFGVFWGFVN